MPMYQIERMEQGERYSTYRVYASSEEEAKERIFEEDIEPDVTWFKSRDGNTIAKRLRDCDCDICKRRGPWACAIEEDE